MNSKENTKRSEKVEAEKVIGFINHQAKKSFSDKENIIYNLSIGFTQDPLKEEDFKYTSDVHEDFCTFPTSAVVIHNINFITPLMTHPNIPKFPIHALLHAEQRIQLVKQKILTGVDYYHESKIIDCVDKGANAIFWYEVNSYEIADGKKQLAFVNHVGLFVRGLGGFGFKGKKLVKALPSVPQRNPDIVKTVQTFPGQAFLYRLNSDRNPLHIDPKVSKAAKFERPIIHGLASYGSVARVFVQEVLGNDPTRLKVFHNRFVGHVFPGQSLTLNIWKDGQNQYIFEAFTNQRKTKALMGTITTRGEAKL